MIRIGIVGCGRILNAHLHGYRKLREAGIDNFRITALVARNIDDAYMFRKRGEGPAPRPPVLPNDSGDPLGAPHIWLDDFQPDTEVAVFSDYHEMIAAGVVDAVNDFTTLSMHHQIGGASLDAGLHLLTQKPLAVSVKAAKLLVNKAAEKGLTLGVFENVRQGERVRAAAWAVESGQIGDLQMALFGGIGGFWSPDVIVAETPWRHKKVLGGGGGAIDIGVHVMHWIRHVCGEVTGVSGTVRTFEPVRHLHGDPSTGVSVEANVDDTYMATVTTAKGAVVQMLWSWAGRGEATNFPGGPIFYGSKGCLKGSEIILDDGSRRDLLAAYRSEAPAALREQHFPHGLSDAFAISQLDWLEAIGRGEDPETSGVEGLYDLAAAFGIIESSHLGRTVSLDEMLSGGVDGYQREIDEHYGIGD